jgi:hypothetical protein
MVIGQPNPEQQMARVITAINAGGTPLISASWRTYWGISSTLMLGMDQQIPALQWGGNTQPQPSERDAELYHLGGTGPANEEWVVGGTPNRLYAPIPLDDEDENMNGGIF